MTERQNFGMVSETLSFCHNDSQIYRVTGWKGIPGAKFSPNENLGLQLGSPLISMVPIGSTQQRNNRVDTWLDRTLESTHLSLLTWCKQLKACLERGVPLLISVYFVICS